MQAIAHILLGNIAPDDRFCYKLKINTVSMPGNSVTYNLKFGAFPAMYSIANKLFVFSVSCYLVVLYKAIIAILDVYTKKIIIQDIV
ncbi:hypothetical protein D3C86_2112300 [compost metagenome]